MPFGELADVHDGLAIFHDHEARGFIFGELMVLGQIGTTIGIGLMFDTLIVRSFMTPSIAALLGRWFWWPLKVRPRPASTMLRPYGTRESVRELLHEDDETQVRADAPTAVIPAAD